MLKLKYSILKSKITEANLTIPKCPQCLNQRVYGLKKPNNIQNITTLSLEVDIFFLFLLLEDPYSWRQTCIFSLVPSELSIQQKLCISHPLICIAVIVSQPFCRSRWNMQVWWNRVQWGGKMIGIVMRITGVFFPYVFVCVCGAHAGRRLTQTHSVLFSELLCHLRVQS